MFTERAQRSLQCAGDEVRRLGHDYIGTEHLLLGLLLVGDGRAARALEIAGLRVDKVQSVISLIIGRGERDEWNEIGLTERGKQVIRHAIEEARRLQHDKVDTEHLLLGLLREDQAVAASLIEAFGVSLDEVRAATMEVMQDGRSDR
jgi:ATP-dependent Clp protease ATP-binding subunit ClpC